MNERNRQQGRSEGGRRSRGRLAVRLYGMALRAFPRRIRRAYGPEMVAAFAASHAAARADGSGEARRYTLKASADAVSAGLRERLGGGGVGAPPPRNPIARWWNRARDLLSRELGSDLRFALRTLRRSPGFALTVILVLALGVGINGAIFTAVNAALLAPLPFEQPDELYLIEYTLAEEATPDRGRAMGWSWPKYGVLLGADLPLEGIAAYSTSSLTLTGHGDAARVEAETITADYFSVLGVDLPLGRPFARVDDDVPLEAVLSSGLWQERFGGREDVVGQTVSLNGNVVTVVGVGPAGFRGLSGEAELWVPVRAVGTLSSPVRMRPQVHWLQAIGRVGDGVTATELRERVAAAVGGVEEAYPMGEPGMVVGGAARSLAEARRNPRAQRAVLVVAVAAGLVLLLACVNLSAIMLARGADRRREIAVRLALGGSRMRVVRGLLMEALLLALGGAVVGIGVAAFATRAALTVWPETFSAGGWNLAFVDPSAFVLDGTAVAFTLALALVAGILFGVVPSLRLSRARLASALKDGDRSGTVSRLRGPVARRWLVAAEIAIALVLLVGAGLMIGSLARLLDIETGFNDDDLLAFEYSLPRDSALAQNPAAFHDQLVERLEALPRVESAAGGLAPLRGLHWSIAGMMRAGERTWEDGEREPVGVHTVTEGYFATLQTPILRGRTFDSRDRADSPLAAVISESAARAYFGTVDPLGKPFAFTYGPAAEGTGAEVIGVVADVLYGTRENGVMPEAYLLQRQNPERDTQVLARTRGEPFDALADVRAVVAGLAPDLPIYGITTVEALGAAQVSDTRTVMQLLAAFAAIAVLLAAVGIWGVVSYSVVQRRRELGIRMALGARANQAVGLILRRGLINAVVGVAAGAAAALALTRYLESLLYEVDPADPLAFAGAAALLLAVALLAAWMPALRATRVQPTETLRSE